MDRIDSCDNSMVRLAMTRCDQGVAGWNGHNKGPGDPACGGGHHKVHKFRRIGDVLERFGRCQVGVHEIIFDLEFQAQSCYLPINSAHTNTTNTTTDDHV